MIAVSQVLIALMCYVWPLLRSIDAIQSRRLDDMRDSLLYWPIFSILYFFEYILIHTVWKKSSNHWITRLIVILWLNHPRTRGADFLYRKVFADIFVKYEKELDAFLRLTVEGIQETIMRQVQLIAWQLLLSPSDGALTVLWKFIRPIVVATQSTLQSHLISYGIFPTHDNNNSGMKGPNHNTMILRRQPSGRSLSQALLQQFVQLLKEEITVEAGTSLRILRPCQITLIKRESTLRLFAMQSSKASISSDADDLLLFSLQFPLVNVTDVCLHPSHPRVIVVKYLPVTKSKGRTMAAAATSLLIRAEDEPESEALLAGLQVLATSSRATAVNVLTAVGEAVDRSIMRKQFALWRKLSHTKTK